MFRGLGRSGPARTAAPCLACDAEHEAESRYLDALLQALRDLPLLARFQASTGLCLPHTRLAVERGKPTSRLVAVHARQVAERLVDELSEVVRKEDYRFRHEPRTPAERTAPGDAVHWIVGSMDAPGRD